jgi:chromosome segregation ATPase
MNRLRWLANYLSTSQVPTGPSSVKSTIIDDETCQSQEKETASSSQNTTVPAALAYDDLADALDHKLSQLSAARTEYSHLCAMQIEAQREMDNGAERIYELEERLRAADDTIAALRHQTNTRVAKLEDELSIARRKLNNQAAEINGYAKRQKDQKLLDTQLQNANYQLRGLQSTNDKLIQDNRKIFADMGKLVQERDEARERYLTVVKDYDEALFQLEHLKCIEAPEIARQRPLYPQPFVVVLIDADAYRVGASRLINRAVILTCKVPERLLKGINR